MAKQPTERSFIKLNEKQQNALKVFEAAREHLNQCVRTKALFGVSRRAEAAYGAAYQGLVRVGLATQIKRKYRG